MSVPTRTGTPSVLSATRAASSREVDAGSPVRPASSTRAVTQPRAYGGTDPDVADRLFALLTEAAWHARAPAQQAAVLRERDRLVSQCLDDLPTGWTVDDVHRRGEAVDSASTRDWHRS